MKKWFIYILVIIPYVVLSQVTPTLNNIHKISYTTPVQEANLASVLETNKIQQVTYYDKLGRPIQTIAVNAGGNLEEVVAHSEYDSMGRESKNYLPYATNATNNLGYISSASTAIAPYYQAKFPSDFQNGVNPYSESVFEKAPSATLINQGAPGSDWKITNDNTDHTVKMEYKTNLDNDVLNFDVQFTGGDYLLPELVFKGYYKKNQLFVSITKNENWKPSDGKMNTTETYKDKGGKVILVRTFDLVSGVVTPHNMYSVYDDFGNITFVISPKASETFNVSLVSLTNFSQNLKFSELINNVSIPVDPNTTVATLSLTGANTLTINYNVILSSGRTFKTGQTALITTSVPNCILGNITNGIYNFEVSILNNYLVITDVAGVPIPRGTAINTSLSINLPTGSVLAPIQAGLLDNLAYQYRYDNRNRMVEKKIPGKKTESVVYDQLNRPILTQDANLKLNNKWLFSKFDVFGRPVYMGEFASTSSRSGLQTIIDAIANPVLFESRTTTTFTNGGAVINYTNTAYPSTSTSLNVLSIKYYDDYNYDKGGLTLPAGPIYTVPFTTNNKGLATGSRDRILETTNWETTLIGYEEKARAIWTATKNDYLTTTQTVEVKYDFVGNVLETKTVHSNTSAAISNLTTYDYFTYDHYLRPLKHTQKIGSVTELITYNQYDDLGNIKQKKVGGADATTYASAAGLQTVDLSYNVRGWLTKINDQASMGTDLFAFEIKYNNPVAGFTPLYNGNISQTQWKTANIDTALKRYNYTYDGLNRLKEAKFFSASGATTTENTYNESLSYDKNGNIVTLQRTGFNDNGSAWDEWLDFLSYTYEANSNKLLAVNDNGNKLDGFKDVVANTDYSYDDNGNLTLDVNKGITAISYNHFNQPKVITLSGTKSIEFVYTAAGTKISKKLITSGFISNTTLYAGNYIYEKNSGPPVLKAFSHAEGYVEVASNTYKYVYQYKDHLGNIRLSYAKNANSGALEILEENNYYPFGVKHKGYNNLAPSSNVALKNKFNGQESEVFNGLNMTEMDFRQYDAAIGRFNCIDLLAEATPMATPYHFVLNNPMIASDPTGLLLAPYDFQAEERARMNAEKGEPGAGGSIISRFGNTRYGLRHERMTNSGMGWGPGTGYSNLYGYGVGVDHRIGFGIIQEFGGSNTKTVRGIGGHWLITTTKNYTSGDNYKWNGFDKTNQLTDIGISTSKSKTWVENINQIMGIYDGHTSIYTKNSTFSNYSSTFSSEINIKKQPQIKSMRPSNKSVFGTNKSPFGSSPIGAGTPEVNEQNELLYFVQALSNAGTIIIKTLKDLFPTQNLNGFEFTADCANEYINREKNN